MTGPSSTDALDGLLSTITSGLLVVSPFITMEAMRHALGHVPSSASLVVFTNWSPRAVRAGVTDPRIFSPVLSRNGRVMLHPRLHAKVFARLPTDGLDAGSALVGSANLTGPGTGWFGVPNLELLVPTTLNEPHLRHFLRLLHDESVQAEAADADLALRAAAHLDPEPHEVVGEVPRSLPPALTVPPKEFVMRLRADALPEPLAALANSWGVTADLDDRELISRIGVGLVDGPYYLLARAVVRSTAADAVEQQHEIYRMRAEAVGVAVDDAATEWNMLMQWMVAFYPQRFETFTAGPAYLAEKFAEVTATF